MFVTVIIYSDVKGIEPFIQWLNRLRDDRTRRRILMRLRRLEQGNFGDCKSLTGGIFELRLRFGSGYRIYYAVIDINRVLLLCGGDKGGQQSDINHARKYWNDYKTCN